VVALGMNYELNTAMATGVNDQKFIMLGQVLFKDALTPIATNILIMVVGGLKFVNDGRNLKIS